MSDPMQPDFSPQALLDFSHSAAMDGATCAWLTPAIKAKLRELDSGQVLEVRVADPSASDDILAWSRLSGHSLLAMYADEQDLLRIYLRKK